MTVKTPIKTGDIIGVSWYARLPVDNRCFKSGQVVKSELFIVEATVKLISPARGIIQWARCTSTLDGEPNENTAVKLIGKTVYLRGKKIITNG